jgi:hypothetical protein
VSKNLLGHFDPIRLDPYVVSKYREPISKWRRGTSQKDEYPRTSLHFMNHKDSVPSLQQPATGFYPAQHEFRLRLSFLLGTHFNIILLTLFHTYKWPLTSCFLTKKKVCVFLLSHAFHVPLLSESPRFISRVRLDDKEKTKLLTISTASWNVFSRKSFRVSFYLYRSMSG